MGVKKKEKAIPVSDLLIYIHSPEEVLWTAVVNLRSRSEFGCVALPLLNLNVFQAASSVPQTS